MFDSGQSKSKACLTVVRTRVKRVLMYSMTENATLCSLPDGLVGLVVKASASRAEGPGFESRLRRDFFGVESCQ